MTVTLDGGGEADFVMATTPSAITLGLSPSSRLGMPLSLAEACAAEFWAACGQDRGCEGHQTLVKSRLSQSLPVPEPVTLTSR